MVNVSGRSGASTSSSELVRTVNDSYAAQEVVGDARLSTSMVIASRARRSRSCRFARRDATRSCLDADALYVRATCTGAGT